MHKTIRNKFTKEHIILMALSALLLSVMMCTGYIKGSSFRDIQNIEYIHLEMYPAINDIREVKVNIRDKSIQYISSSTYCVQETYGKPLFDDDIRLIKQSLQDNEFITWKRQYKSNVQIQEWEHPQIYSWCIKIYYKGNYKDTYSGTGVNDDYIPDKVRNVIDTLLSM